MSSIICVECGNETEKTGHSQKYCPDCRSIIVRKQRTESERNRRKRLGDVYRESDRKRRSTPEGLEKHRQSSRNYYNKMKDNSDWKDKTAKIHAKSMDKWLNKRDFGGNWYKVFERDNQKCQVCGSSEHLCVHHKDRTGWDRLPEEKNNSMSNLILLCDSCHAKIHDLGGKKK